MLSTKTTVEIPSLLRKHARRFYSDNLVTPRPAASHVHIDICRLRVQGGSGGRGSSSMFSFGKRKRRPDGGHGGSGGSVVLVVDRQCTALPSSRKHVTARSGAPGSSGQRHGRAGANTILRLPPGVLVKRILDGGEVYDAETGLVTRMGDDDDGEDDTVPSYWWEDSDEEVDNDDDDVDSEDDEHNDSPTERQQKMMSHADYGDAFDQASGKKPRKARHPAAIDKAGLVEDAEQEQMGDSSMPYGGRQVVTLADLDQHGAHLVVARGGRGGIGTFLCRIVLRHGLQSDHNLPIHTRALIIITLLCTYTQAHAFLPTIEAVSHLRPIFNTKPHPKKAKLPTWSSNSNSLPI